MGNRKLWMSDRPPPNGARMPLTPHIRMNHARPATGGPSNVRRIDSITHCLTGSYRCKTIRRPAPQKARTERPRHDGAPCPRRHQSNRSHVNKLQERRKHDSLSRSRRLATGSVLWEGCFQRGGRGVSRGRLMRVTPDRTSSSSCRALFSTCRAAPLLRACCSPTARAPPRCDSVRAPPPRL